MYKNKNQILMRKNVNLMRSIWSIVVISIISVFVYFYFAEYIVVNMEMFAKFSDEELKIFDFKLVSIFILVYVIFAIFICMVVRVFKFLKSYKEKGLIYYLIQGFLWGLIFGILCNFIGGFIFAFVGMLFTGLFLGLFKGLISEFYSDNVFWI